MTGHRVCPWGLTALVLTLVASAGCSDDTGLLIRVTRDPSVTSFADISDVEIFVGVADADPPDERSEWYSGDPDPEQRVSTAGRDLVDRPLTLLLEPSDELAADAEVFVAAVGRNGQEIVAIGTIEGTDGDPRSVPFVSDMVVIWDVVLEPLELTSVDVTTEGCLRWSGPDATVIVSAPTDDDCDDDPDTTDCAPEDPRIHHGATDDCSTDTDEDCDGDGHNETDNDSDEISNCDGDCDDNNRDVYPDAPEQCDGVDNDCEVRTPCDPDPDGDGWTTCGKVFREGDGWKCDRTSLGDDGCGLNEQCDCREGDAIVHPGAMDLCDGRDNDCSTATGCDEDGDNDGYTACGTIVWSGEGDARDSQCALGCGALPGVACDCDASDGTAGGPLPERCDGLDNGCDGQRYPERTPCFTVVEGVCRGGERACDDVGPPGMLGECTVTAGSPELPPSVCAAYAACEREGDPYVCMLDQASSRFCQVDVESGRACQPASVDLRPVADSDAMWRIVGGQSQGPWTVGLRKTGTLDAPTAQLQGPAVTFVVESLNQSVPEGDRRRVILARFASGAVELIELQLVVDLDACDDENMTCASVMPSPI